MFGKAFRFPVDFPVPLALFFLSRIPLKIYRTLPQVLQVCNSLKTFIANIRANKQ